MTVNLEGRRIAVFCGAREVAPDYFALARITGAAIAESGATLIYGSGNYGLMGAVSAGAREHGGKVIGVKPEFMVEVEEINTESHRTIVTSHMHDRKAWMEEQSDAFIVLPGGLGTLDELITVMTTKQLRQHRKPIVLLDPTRYYEPLLHLFDHMIAHDFVHPATTPLPYHAETPGEALTYVEKELQTTTSGVAQS